MQVRRPEKSRPEEGFDEAEAAEQEAAERTAPAPAPAGGVLPRRRRHLQVRVRGVLHQRVAYHVYVPAAAGAADDAGRGGAPRRRVPRRRQDVPEAGVPVPAAILGVDRDFDPRRGARRRPLERRAPVP